MWVGASGDEHLHIDCIAADLLDKVSHDRGRGDHGGLAVLRVRSRTSARAQRQRAKCHGEDNETKRARRAAKATTLHALELDHDNP